MNKAVKMSALGIGIVATLFVVAVVVFASTFDINDYKGRIASAVADETGRTLVFKDDLALSFFPGIGVELGGVSLSNAKGFGSEPMVHADHARVTVKVLPLLKGAIKFGRLELDGLVLNLSRNQAGVANWEDLVGRTPREEAKEEGKFSLEIGGVSIRGAQLVWDDRKSDTRFVLSGVNLETGQIYEGAPFPVKASLNYDCTNPQAKGSLTLSGKSSIDLTNREYGHMDMKLSVTAEGGAIPGGKGSADVAVQFLVLDFNKEHAQVTGLTVTTYGATLHLDGSVEGITDGMKKIVGTMTVDPFDARRTLTDLGGDPSQTADSSALTKLGGMADFIYKPGDLDLKTVQLNLDDTRIIGQARIHQPMGIQSYFVRLDVGELDLDRYLPPDHAETRQAAKDDADGNERVIDGKWLRGLLLDAEAKVAQLRVDGVRLENVNIAAKSKNGILRINPVAADLYGGKLSAAITVDASGQYPATSIIAGLDKVDIGALSNDTLGDESYKGILDFNGAVSCEGERISPMLRSMNGKVGFHLADGVFPGVDIADMTKETHESKQQEGGKVEAEKGDSTRFGSIRGTGVIKAGVLRNRDLEVKAPGLRADGEGAIVLPTRQIDYLIKAKLVASKEGQGGKSSDDLYGVMVPIRVAGTIDNPRYWVSITEYAKALGGAVLKLPGAILGGVAGAIKGVGKAVDQDCCEEDKTGKEEPRRKKFLGIF